MRGIIVKKINYNKNYIYIGVICLLCIVLIILLNSNDNSKEDIIKNDNYLVINNASNFFTIENCVNKYINAIKSKDTDSVMLLLNNEYRIHENITVENVYDFVPNINNKTTFQAKKIYNKKNSNQYYIYGYFMEETIDSLKITDNFYTIVTINKNNNTFDVTPYDGSIFIEDGVANG